MASVLCSNFNMRDEDILEDANGKYMCWRFNMQEEDILCILMPSVICAPFSQLINNCVTTSMHF